MRYWMVVCSRGHCGVGHETEIKFAIAAENLIRACDIARKMPSVKHTRMALYGKEITEEEFVEFRKVSAYERYEHHKASHYRKRRR